MITGLPDSPLWFKDVWREGTGDSGMSATQVERQCQPIGQSPLISRQGF